MRWTNNQSLPAPIASAIINDTYQSLASKAVLKAAVEDYGLKSEDVISGKIPNISVTSLIKPVRMLSLEHRYDDKVEADVADSIYRMFGSMIHELLSRSEGNTGEHRERRLVALIDGVLVHGEPDLITAAGIIDDYKVIAVNAFQRGMKIEWEQQLNAYAALLRQKISEGYDLPLPTQLRIIPILRDWKKSEVVKHEYPKSAAQIMPVEMWEAEKAAEFLRSRSRAHLLGRDLDDESLPECSDEEAWIKPESWAVQRAGSERALRVIRVPGAEGNEEATQLMLEKNSKLKKNEKPYEVHHRPGEATRCLSYCAAAPFCSQFKAYKAVAWGTQGPKEEGEEHVG